VGQIRRDFLNVYVYTFGIVRLVARVLGWRQHTHTQYHSSSLTLSRDYAHGRPSHRDWFSSRRLDVTMSLYR